MSSLSPTSLRSRRFVLARPLAPVGLIVGLILVLAGCGASTTPGVALSGSPAATLGPTATPRPTLAPTPVGQHCNTLMPPGQQAAATVGDIQFTSVGALAVDPARQLPDTLPSQQPYQLSAPSGYLDSFPMVNVTYYSFALCNTSTTKAHVVNGISVKLDAFTADANTINTSHYCIRLYTRQGMVDHTGCGGGFAGGDLNLVASFANTTTAGTVVQSSTDPAMGSAQFPVTLSPGYGIYCFFNITPSSTPGTSSYRFGAALDGAAPIYPVPAAAGVTNAKSLRQWDGDSCTSAAMQSQIPPATNPPSYYICPQS